MPTVKLKQCVVSEVAEQRPNPYLNSRQGFVLGHLITDGFFDGSQPPPFMHVTLPTPPAPSASPQLVLQDVGAERVQKPEKRGLDVRI